MMGLLEWALYVALKTFVLLIIAILFWLLFNVVMRVFGGPELTYVEAAVITAIVSVSVGGFTFTVFKRQAPTSA